MTPGNVTLIVVLSIVAVASIILLHDVAPALNAVKTAYEEHLDAYIVFAVAVIAYVLFAVALRAYLQNFNPKIAYVAGAFLLYAVKLSLVFIDVATGRRWLPDSVNHIMDLGILLLFFIGVLTR